MKPSSELEQKLDVLIRLTALLLVGERTGADAIVALARAEIDNDLIADLVGTSAATVRSTLSRARRKGKGTG